MLTLEQARAINDALQNGDLNAALEPLENTIDLRHAEQPRLEKGAVAALKTGLKTPQNAQIWAAAAFHPNISVRRFVRKTFLAFKSDGAPIAAPLRACLEQFWAEETPLPDSSKPKEAAARREQMEIVQSVLEILLRADAEAFMAFYLDLIDETPLERRQNAQWDEWSQKHRAYGEAFQEHRKKIITAEWGAEYLDWNQYRQLPTRIWNEIEERVKNVPEVRQLLPDLGENPWQNAARSWFPESEFQGVMLPVLQSEFGPQREIAAMIRRQVWDWFELVLENGEKRSLHRIGATFSHSYYLRDWLGREELWQKAPALLEKTKTELLPQLSTQYQKSVPRLVRSRGDVWCFLVIALANSCVRPYQIKPEDWQLPEHITPELLERLKIQGGDTWRINSALIAAIKALKETPPQTEEAVETETDSPLHFSFDELKAFLQKSKPISPTADKTEAQVAALPDGEKRIETLVNPPDPKHKLAFDRANFWRTLAKQIGEDKLKQRLWPRGGPLLWARYEAKLEDYRRAKTDEPTAKLEEKLTAGELKKWKTEQRRLERQRIERELFDIAQVLRDVEGFEAETRLLVLLKKPGFKELLTKQYSQILATLGYTYFNHDEASQKQGRDPQWLRENWFLPAKWAPLIAEIEIEYIGDERGHDWQRKDLLGYLAVAYYRLATPESRAKFREIMANLDSNLYGVSRPVAALGDVEIWLLLVERMEWQNADLKELWQRGRAAGGENAQKIGEQLLDLAATTSREKSAKFIVEMLDEVAPEEWQNHAAIVVAALESPIVPIKRWALKILAKLDDFDREMAANLAGEMLWNENASLVKDAAKFLGGQAGDSASIAWEALQDATSLENLPVLEAIFRALATLKSKNKTLELGESARERLGELGEAAPERFGKFGRKF